MIAHLDGTITLVKNSHSEKLDWACDYEEADTKMFVACKYLVDRHNIQRIIIYSPDTDVLMYLYEKMYVLMYLYEKMYVLMYLYEKMYVLMYLYETMYVLMYLYEKMYVLMYLYEKMYEHFVNYFVPLSNATRNNGTLLRLPAVKLEAGKNSFKFMGAKIFNELPVNIRLLIIENSLSYKV